MKLNLETGQRQVLAREAAPLGGCYALNSGKPSPSGDSILLERAKSQTCGFERPKYDIQITVLDANLKTKGTPFAGVVTEGWQLKWISESVYELQDNEKIQQFEVPTN